MSGTVRVSVASCGPVMNSEVEVPVPGVVVFIGPNLTGKSLLGTAIASYLFANCVLQSDDLAEHLGASCPADLALSLISEYDPLDLASLEGAPSPDALGRHTLLSEAYPALSPEGRALRYLALVAFVAEFSEALNLGALSASELREAIFPEERGELSVELKLGFNGAESDVTASVPLPMSRLSECNVRLRRELGGLIGLKCLNPYTLHRSVLAGGGPLPPSLELVRRIAREYQIAACDAASKLGEALNKLVAYSELTCARGLGGELAEDLRRVGDKVALIKRRGELALRVGDLTVPQSLFSKGLRSLVSHYLLAHCAIYLAKGVGLTPVVYLDEPEVSLDSIAAFMLLELYRPVLEVGGSVVVTTHREDLMLQYLQVRLERGDELVNPSTVRVYEFLPEVTESGISVKARSCKVTEDFIEAGKVDRVIKLMFEAAP